MWLNAKRKGRSLLTAQVEKVWFSEGVLGICRRPAGGKPGPGDPEVASGGPVDLGGLAERPGEPYEPSLEGHHGEGRLDLLCDVRDRNRTKRWT